MSSMKVKIKDIQPNPFRHMDRYPIREDKIEALRKSIRTTTFWDNIVARKVGGVVQISHGHHRLEALRREYDGEHEITLIQRSFSDENMLKSMADENREEWGTSAGIEHETVRAVVEAYAEGKIELAVPKRVTTGGALRYAPSFQEGSAVGPDRPRPYTAQSIADFLDWVEPSGKPQEKVHNALSALAFIEDGTLDEHVFDGLSTKQAEALVQETRQTRRQADQAAKLAKQAAAKHAAEVAAQEKAQVRAAANKVKAQEAAERAQARAAAAEKAQAAAKTQAAVARAKAQAQAAEKAKAAAAARAATAKTAQAEAAKARAAAKVKQDVANAAAKARATEAAKAKEDAAKVAEGVGAAMRGGQGYANAQNIAGDIKEKLGGQKPKIDLDAGAAKVAEKIFGFLSPLGTGKKLDEELKFLVLHKDKLSPKSIKVLASAFIALFERAQKYANEFGVAVVDNDGVLDVEFIDTTGIKEIAT